MKPFRILVADDEATLRDTLSTVLKDEGYEVSCAKDGGEALSLLKKENFDVILCDIKMPQADGLEVLDYVSQRALTSLFIIITAYGSLELTMKALKNGAHDFVTKPLLFDELLIKIEHLLKHHKMLTHDSHKEEIEDQHDFNHIIGQGPEMRAIYSLVQKVANLQSPILITGERGTGKEILAKAIHYNSIHGKKRLVSIRCGAWPADVLERELFGSEAHSEKKDVMQSPKGEASREGFLSRLIGGTVYLDDVHNLSLSLQGRLVKILQEKEMIPISGKKSKNSDFRLIAATPQDLGALVVKGEFREDLFYKINVIEIKLPPLRARKNDIPFLVKHFIQKFNREPGKRAKYVDKQAMECLMAYSWKGNIGELKNVIERAVLLSENNQSIRRQDLPRNLTVSESGAELGDNFREAVKGFESQHIRQVLQKNAHDKRKAAEALGMSLSSLYRKLEELAQ